MAKGREWSVRESSAPIVSAAIMTGPGSTAIVESTLNGKLTPTRALMGLVAPAGTNNLDLYLTDGTVLTLPGATVSAVFAPGGIVPFAITAFKFAAGTESAFKIVAIY